MAEALAISAANLNTIEKNLDAVATELSGVISNVNSVNSQVSKVEERVESLNDEVKNLVKEIRETTIITNARQSIMYNNEQIEKKFGYYDVVRRNTEALISAILNSNLKRDSIIKLRENLILNNPNYWLTNALAALSSWVLDDRDNCYKELQNALNINDEKTSLFFTLINLKFKRINTSINWLNRYLSKQDPSSLSNDFVTILDLVSTGAFGDEAKQVVLDKINNWFYRLSGIKNLKEDNIKRWEEYLKSKEDTLITMPMLELYSTNVEQLKSNLAATSTYEHVLDGFVTIINQSHSTSSIDNIISNLIYNYEDKENEFQTDNLKNNLIIACNGNREEAEELFKKQQIIYNEKVDLISLLTNIIIYSEEYKISPETKKLALGLIKDNIQIALQNHNKNIYNGNIDIKITDFQTRTINGENYNEIKNDINLYINNKFKDDSKDLIIALILINILGIVGIFVTLKNKILTSIIIGILIIGDLILLSKLHQKTTLTEKAKANTRSNLNILLEKVNVEVIDYWNLRKNDEKKIEELNTFLNNIRINDYLKTNNERNIEIGDTNGRY